MKLSLSRNFRGARGLEKFGSLLIQRLVRDHGVQIVNKKSDIHLIIIQGEKKSGAKNVVRLDGVYYDVNRLRMNSPIKKSIKRSDGVIYQSQWCKTFVEGMLQVRPSSFAVIHNGCDQSCFKSASINKMGFEEVMLACAHWRVNKRLKTIVSSFIEAQKMCQKNIGMVVLGDPDYRTKHPRIKYLNYVERDKLYSLYRSSDYMCHICHLDACPNSVVDGLSAGLPVLCNNIGGTPELVGNDGIIVDIDRPFDFKPIRHMGVVGPVSVESEKVVQGMLSLFDRQWEVRRPDLDIKVSAQKYYDFFRDLLK